MKRPAPTDSRWFREHRQRLNGLLEPGSLAVLQSNDILPTNADGTVALVANSDLFYLTGLAQEETILVLFPTADDERHREILFLRETSDLIATWEGHKLTKEEARKISGIEHVEWVSEFPRLFHRLMCESQRAYLNSNEHKRADVVVESRDARFIAETQRKYPLHEYRRLAQMMHRLRVVKSAGEMEWIQAACDVTKAGFERVAKFVAPGVNEMEIEAEFAHEFIRQGNRFAYLPIIASGANACVLHYTDNDQPCKNGDLLLLDVAAARMNYNSDLTRTIPVNGRFTRRQKQVYNAVLRVLRASIAGLTPGKRTKEWQKEAEQMIEKECVDLGLLTVREIKKQDPENPAFKKYFMHGVGHPIGLDVHDVGHVTEPFQVGWVMTVEPAIYIQEEGFAVRLENDIAITENGPRDLMETIPIEADAIEELMNSK